MVCLPKAHLHAGNILPISSSPVKRPWAIILVACYDGLLRWRAPRIAPIMMRCGYAVGNERYVQAVSLGCACKVSRIHA